jgi:predicted amidohydrolase
MIRQLTFAFALVAISVSNVVAVDAPAKTLRVGSLSIFPEKWNKQANAEKIERMVRDAARQKAELVITPEGVLEGYVVNEFIHEKDPEKKAALAARFREVAEPADGPYLKRFAALSKELKIHLILGYLEADGEKTFNTAALFGPDGKRIGFYRKTHFAQGYDVNPPGYTPGDDYPVFQAGKVKVGMMICFDRQLPEPARHLAVAGADIIACPAYGSWGEWNTQLMQVRARENQSYVIFTHPNISLIISPRGKLLSRSSKDQVLIHEIDISNVDKKRGPFTNRRPETFKPGKTR